MFILTVLPGMTGRASAQAGNVSLDRFAPDSRRTILRNRNRPDTAALLCAPPVTHLQHLSVDSRFDEQGPGQQIYWMELVKLKIVKSSIIRMRSSPIQLMK
jgi:hypothetical protein